MQTCTTILVLQHRQRDGEHCATPARLWVSSKFRHPSRQSDHPGSPPEGDWSTWLFLGGRGAGKTVAGVAGSAGPRLTVLGW